MPLRDPLVTIGIPTFERLPLLKEAVASALNQTCQRIEILISDDGTNAGIERWGREMAVQHHSRVRYERNTGTRGLAGNWNSVAGSAIGEFLVIIGDDDRLLPEFAETLLATIEPGNAIAFSNHYVIDAAGLRDERRTAEFAQIYKRGRLTPGIVDAEKCAWSNSIAISSALLRTEDVRRLRFKEDLNTPEIELFVRLASEGRPFRFVPEYLMEYRVHGDSATAGGLEVERLALRLLDVEVSVENKLEKRRFMEGIVPVAITNLLAHGMVNDARRLWESGFCAPSFRFAPRGLVTAACLMVPRLTPALLKSARWLKRWRVVARRSRAA